MKYNRVSNQAFILIFLSFFCLMDNNLIAQKKKKKKSSNASSEQKKDPSNKTTIKPFKEIITDKAITDTGMFYIHNVESVYYFEIPDSLLERDMLIVSRRASMSGSEQYRYVAGERTKSGLMVRWEKSPDNKNIFLKKVTSRNKLRFKGKDMNFKNAIDLQTLDPIMLSFPIKAFGKDSTSTVIDMNPLYVEDITEISPFYPPHKSESKEKYSLDSKTSFIKKVLSFEKNIEVRSMLTYGVSEGVKKEIISILVHRSMILLPEIPMKPRIRNKRVGYFAHSFLEYDETHPVKSNALIKRWRLEVKEGDKEKFKQGILIEPKKKIVFYIDNNTPEKWKPYFKKGVEDWLPAFEEAGFKNAIEVKNFPKDSSYHPEDIRFSVIRYVASPVSNAKGPSVLDPRSGEILDADIIVYHNLLSILKNWRFTQTAANDKNVQGPQISDSIMGEAVRYVIAHEVGHTLGLQHDMIASASYPVDSLRSPSFTQKYGTTPSIMDYARFNYVAQPEDKGVALSPPRLGIYDKYAIKWGYKPILEAKTCYDELEILKEWIREKRDDSRYHFMIYRSDPRYTTEALGDDPIKASEYGIKNTRYILKNLVKWCSENGKEYDNIEEFYMATLFQYKNYLTHVGRLIGGVYAEYPWQGEEESFYRYVPKEKQREAINFLINEYKTFPHWVQNNDLLKNKLNFRMGFVVIPPAALVELWYRSSIKSHILNNKNLAKMIDAHVSNAKDYYTIGEFFDDVRSLIFEKTIAGKKLNYYDQLLQNVYLDLLLNDDNFRELVDFKSDKLGKKSANNMIASIVEQDANVCSYAYLEKESLASQNLGDENATFFSLLFMPSAQGRDKISAYSLYEIKKIRQLVSSRIRDTSDTDTKIHYEYVLKKLGLYLK